MVFKGLQSVPDRDNMVFQIANFKFEISGGSQNVAARCNFLPAEYRFYLCRKSGRIVKNLNDYGNTGSARQISRAYSDMVRSLENGPILATFRIDFRVHSDTPVKFFPIKSP